MRTPIILESPDGLTASRPLMSEMSLMRFLQWECDAQGFRVENGELLALRWDASGSQVIVGRFQITPVAQRPSVIPT